MKLELTLQLKKNINNVSLILGIGLTLSIFFVNYKKSPEKLMLTNILAISTLLLSMNKIDYDYESKLLKTKHNIFLAKKRLITQQKLDYELNNIKGIKPVINQEIEPIPETISVNQNIVYRQLEKIERESNHNWLTKIISNNSSCIIVGRKGFGKSHLMRYMARSYVATMSELDLFVIVDPHYDSDEPWLFQDENELIKREKIIVGNYNVKIHELLSLVKYRIEKKLFYKNTNSKLRIFIDEIEFFQDNEEFIELVKTIEYECRKFGISIVLGGHSLKKSVSKLDSSVIGSMAILMSPNIALDPSTIKPGLFPSLTNMKSRYNQTNKENVGFFTDGENFDIVKIPRINLTTLEII